MSNQRNITIIAGDTYTQEVVFTESQASYTFVAYLNAVRFTASLGDDQRTLTLTLYPSQTAALDLDDTVYKWNLKRYSADATPEVTTILYGKATILSV